VIDWRFVDVGAVHLVWAALAVVALLAWLELRSRGALTAFLSPAMQARLATRAGAGRTAVRLSLVLAALLAGVAALMRPQARGEHETVAASNVSGEIVFVLDTSRSMLAEDAAPNRLARAKAEIAQMVSRLEGQRVGLVAFAGRAALMCPLTPDRAFFTTVLSTLDTRSAGRGGTKIGEAIKTALRGFSPGGGARLVVLITDGDDQDPYSEEAAKAARDAGVKIVAVGLGSEAGSEITLHDPDTGAKSTLVDGDGKPVVSKLNAEQLRKIALVTEGAYVPAGTSAIDLDSIMESYVQPIVREAADAAVRRIPAERYPWFVLTSLACLLAALWVGAGATERTAA
jgi:Ca-activated chloride channel family protein